MIRHVHIHDNEQNVIPDGSISAFKHNGNNILKGTEDILLWKASHGIPMAALNDEKLTRNLPPGILFSDKTNQDIMNDMCEQIIQKKENIWEANLSSFGWWNGYSF